MIIINTPHNPSGQVFSAHDLQQLAAVTRNTDIIILSDEVYEHVVFDGEPHHGMATTRNWRSVASLSHLSEKPITSPAGA
jgi:aspartate/methionine/tyrosine aminotransferase